MNNRKHGKAYIYPAWCFSISPTYNTWVKLTAAEVHELQRAKGGFQGQKLYFWVNHPIRFVRVVGPIVAIDDINPKYTILTLDDGSGATLGIKIIRRQLDDPNNPVDCPDNTEVANLNVISSLGVSELALAGNLLDIGTVVKVKGTLEEFRGVKQLELKRISIVKTTDEEVKAWNELAQFRKNILSEPWKLSNREIKQLEDGIAAQRRKDEERTRQKRERHLQQKAKYMEYLERKKQHDIKRDLWLAKMEEKMSANALDRRKPSQ
ncbi:hypothetical protein EV356DRAFT_442330 [Viridothelium virens]|uniref:CST complex subunit STN1 n=1 Tax=Viridothelium virens TaxID=1048519 RepID=A0A6A6HGI3_VIRVR|nr:hypothetical protein EV356DRAFT_442330 [Viridothelium virens]